jgi:hypothetical protein
MTIYILGESRDDVYILKNKLNIKSKGKTTLTFKYFMVMVTKYLK